MQQVSFDITPNPPFSFQLTATYATAFLGEIGSDFFRDDAYYRLVECEERALLLSVASTGEAHYASLQVTLASEEVTPESVEHASAVVGRILGLEADLEGFYKIARKDSVLSLLANRLYGLRPSGTPTPFEALVLAITGQQLASAVARKIRELLISKLGHSYSFSGHLYRGFPTPAAVLKAGVPGLREFKLSTRKAEYILDIALKAQEGALDAEVLQDKGCDEAARLLGQLRGVGQWTVQWVLLRALGCTDAFPASDIALQRAISRFYLGGEPVDEERAIEFGERWRPYRGLATTYLFAGMRMGILP